MFFQLGTMTSHRHPRRSSNSAGSSNDSRRSNHHEMVRRILSCGNESYHDILQVKKTATVKEIKVAFKKLILKIHPDKNATPEATKATQKLNHAYKTLITRSRRGNKMFENQQPRPRTRTSNAERKPQSSRPRFDREDTGPNFNRRSTSNGPQHSSGPNSNRKSTSEKHQPLRKIFGKR